MFFKPTDGYGMQGEGLCWGYGNVKVAAKAVCDSWAAESNYKREGKR